MQSSPKIASIHRSGPSAVTYHIPTQPPTSSHPVLKTTIVLPPSSHWTSGLHFHRKYIEYLRLIQGCITVQLDGATKIFSAAAGGEIDAHGRIVNEGLVVIVKRGVRHNWGRAEHFEGEGLLHGKGEWKVGDWEAEVVVEEWTDPSDIVKQLFFWNLNGIVTEKPDAPLPSAAQRLARWLLGAWWVDVQLMVLFWQLDNWPIFVSAEGLWLGSVVGRLVESLVSIGLLGVVTLLAGLVGLKGVEEGRTPSELWRVWFRDKEVKKEE